MPQGSSPRLLGLVFISIAVALIIVDSTIVNAAIPSIVADLGLTSTQVQFAAAGFLAVGLVGDLLAGVGEAARG